VTYGIGVDLGTTFTAAAVQRSGPHHAEMVPLGARSHEAPSVVYYGSDGTYLFGDAAERRARTDPERVARAFKRRLGDATPLLLGGVPHSPQQLMARQLAWVLTTVEEREGGEAEVVAVSHPANWGAYRRELFDRVVELAGLDGERVVTLTEPEAAAVAYAASDRVADGAVVAVYDLGGGTFDAAVLRSSNGSFELLGEPAGIEQLGGVDFDEAVLGHVIRALGDSVGRLNHDDPVVAADLVRMRQECVAAKEALSSDVETVVPVTLPGLRRDVRLTRQELEAVIGPALAPTIASLRRALRSAEVAPDDLATVLLVGGSSRIPLVAQLVGAAVERPVAVNAHPKHLVASGAAIRAADLLSEPAPFDAAVRQPAVPRSLPTSPRYRPGAPSVVVTPVDRGADVRPATIVGAGTGGALVAADGTTFPLDTDYVIGREPTIDPEVRAGRARPLAVVDSDLTASRVHAAIRVRNGGVEVIDLRSANGTYVVLPGATRWLRVGDRGTPVPSGARVLVGNQVLTVRLDG
jgi:molecular chaperone DnaK